MLAWQFRFMSRTHVQPKSSQSIPTYYRHNKRGIIGEKHSEEDYFHFCLVGVETIYRFNYVMLHCWLLDYLHI
jgi:hypothetical protein